MPAGCYKTPAAALSRAWAALGLGARTPRAVMSTGTVVLVPLTLASNVFVAPLTAWLCGRPR